MHLNLNICTNAWTGITNINLLFSTKKEDICHGLNTWNELNNSFKIKSLYINKVIDYTCFVQFIRFLQN